MAPILANPAPVDGPLSRAPNESSLTLEVYRLDDRPPLFGLGLLKGGEGLRGLLLAWGNVEAHLDDALANAGIGDRIHGGGVELGDSILGRPLGNKQCVPDR